MTEAGLVADRARRLIDFSIVELGDEFRPAHLSVALIDAIFTTRLHYESQVLPVIKRYCRHFGLRRTRPDGDRFPPLEDQETLAVLVGHFEKYGVVGMEEKVFQARYRSPGTSISKAENIHRAAVELRRIELENLQDAASKPPEDIKCALRPLKGIGPQTIHMFLMYVGNEDYVKGDVHICRFVADALATRRVHPNAAEHIVREAAGILAITPRLLDYAIWQYGSGTRGNSVDSR